MNDMRGLRQAKAMYSEHTGCDENRIASSCNKKLTYRRDNAHIAKTRLPRAGNGSMGHGSWVKWVKSSMGHLVHGSLWVTHSLLWDSLGYIFVADCMGLAPANLMQIAAQLVWNDA